MSASPATWTKNGDNYYLQDGNRTYVLSPKVLYIQTEGHEPGRFYNKPLMKSIDKIQAMRSSIEQRLSAAVLVHSTNV